MARYDWDRLTDETMVEYQRFLCYTSLGPSRSLDKAYRRYCKRVAGEDTAGGRPKVAPGSWQENSTRNRWRERAHAWDVSKLKAYGNRLVVLWVHGVELLAVKAYRAARRHKPGDDAWADVLNTYRVLASHLSPEGVRAVGEVARQSGDELEPAAEEVE
jgi:hypothetical protein